MKLERLACRNAPTDGVSDEHVASVRPDDPVSPFAMMSCCSSYKSLSCSRLLFLVLSLFASVLIFQPSDFAIHSRVAVLGALRIIVSVCIEHSFFAFRAPHCHSDDGWWHVCIQLRHGATTSAGFQLRVYWRTLHSVFSWTTIIIMPDGIPYWKVLFDYCLQLLEEEPLCLSGMNDGGEEYGKWILSLRTTMVGTVPSLECVEFRLNSHVDAP